MHAVEELVWRGHMSPQHDGSLFVDNGVDFGHLGIVNSLFVAHRYYLKARANGKAAEVGLHDTELYIHLVRSDDPAHDVTHLCQLAGMGCDIGHNAVEGGCHTRCIQLMTGSSQFVLSQQQAALDLICSGS